MEHLTKLLRNSYDLQENEPEKSAFWHLQQLRSEIKQLALHDVSKSLKAKHTQDLFEYKQQLKETDNNDTLFIDNKEEWIRQTSILAGKITILEDL
jgi:hypothetical protein